ncbi:MAG: hypothetical protein C0599_10020 [Salinivirgaceae bacterium]|nr:MAG: hypothetical protein C0599_10020 [Salinivirgaceae bacterium]
MTNKLNYIILKEEELILEYYCGKFYAEELIDFKRKIGLDPCYKASFDVISDIRNSELLFSFDEVEKYVEFLFKNPEYIGARKTAMITKTPNQVVASLGFDMQRRKLPMSYKIFSTFEAAYTFLELSSTSINNVDSAINKLRIDCDCSFKIDTKYFTS